MTAPTSDVWNSFAHLAPEGPIAGQTGPLAGVTIAVKDNVDVAGMPTGHGSPLFDADRAAADAPAVAQLRSAGAAIVAKTNMTPLACGTDGRNPHVGNVLNPLNPAHHPGGSSSGSASAVAAGLVDIALGSDTGGSIRVPAAACGVVGLKPTYGRVSTDGMGVCARSLDHLGPLARTVEMAGRALAQLQHHHWAGQTPSRPVAALRVGVLVGDFVDQCSHDVRQATDHAVAAVRSLGCPVSEVELGLDLAAVDAHANVLSRDLFETYGDQIDAAPDAHVGDELRRWLALYRQVSDVAYEAALAEQRRVRTVVATAQAEVDILMCATLRALPSRVIDVVHEDRSVRTGNLTLFNMTGQPSLTVPFGSAPHGLRHAVLFTGRDGDDESVLALGAAFERIIG